MKLRELAVRKKLKISEYGVFDEGGRRIAGRTEAEVYAAVGLPWIPPELREDTGEIEAALAGGLPSLLEVGHIRGDLHAHTDWSDGHHPLEELVAAAEARGYEYIIVSDHSRSTTIARGLTPEQLREQLGKIRALQPRHRIRILAGTECDILADGSLDFPDEVLAELDVVLAAVHSRHKQPGPEMTARICRALENPHVRILVHPTGRLLGSREPYDVDLEQVFATAKRHGKAVEINASPEPPGPQGRPRPAGARPRAPDRGGHRHPLPVGAGPRRARRGDRAASVDRPRARRQHPAPRPAARLGSPAGASLGSMSEYSDPRGRQAPKPSPNGEGRGLPRGPSEGGRSPPPSHLAPGGHRREVAVDGQVVGQLGVEGAHQHGALPGEHRLVAPRGEVVTPGPARTIRGARMKTMRSGDRAPSSRASASASNDSRWRP